MGPGGLSQAKVKMYSRSSAGRLNSRLVVGGVEIEVVIAGAYRRLLDVWYDCLGVSLMQSCGCDPDDGRYLLVQLIKT